MQQGCMNTLRRALRLRSAVKVWSDDANVISARSNFRPLRRDLHGSRCLSQEVVALRKELKDSVKASRSGRKSDGGTNQAAAEEIDGWELTVGIEIHAQLNTSHKLFSHASTSPTENPNTNLAPFDLALPGSQPVFQQATLIPALRAAIALNCDIEPVSYFDRKHYFYHDQPSGYQITQYYYPLARDGIVVLDESDGLASGDKISIGIKQIQLEQDTARTRDQDDETSLVDFNRAGHPLIEIISLPHIHTPKAAASYVRKVQGILNSVDALMAGLELGGMRADVNVSVRRTDSQDKGHSYSGVTGLGQRTEIKNLNAFKGVEDAIRAERNRQIQLIEAGGTVEGETRGWSVTSPHTTRSLRGKEGEVDYRYMPDPDIPPLRIDEDIVRHLHETMPFSPDQSITVLCNKYGLSPLDASALLSLDDENRLYYFLDVMKTVSKSSSSSHASTETQRVGRVVGNWVLHELGSLLSTADCPWTPNLVSARQLARIISLQDHGTITNVSAKQMLKMIFNGDTRPVDKIVEDEKLTFVPMAESEYEKLARDVISEFPEHVRDIVENGKQGKVMFLLGQMMKRAERGKVEAKKAEQVLRKALFEDNANKS